MSVRDCTYGDFRSAFPIPLRVYYLWSRSPVSGSEFVDEGVDPLQVAAVTTHSKSIEGVGLAQLQRQDANLLKYIDYLERGDLPDDDKVA